MESSDLLALIVLSSDSDVEKETVLVLAAILGTGANNQNRNLRWYLPWRGGGLEGVSSATYLFWKMIFIKNHLESFPDCENVFCT